jgi:hypothetical protein
MGRPAQTRRQMFSGALLLLALGSVCCFARIGDGCFDPVDEEALALRVASLRCGHRENQVQQRRNDSSAPLG